MRTFHFSDSKSHKFWTIEVSGDTFTVTYGKVGSAGQAQTKTFATPEKAQAEAAKLVAEKTKKGYAETTARAPASDAEAFERKLAANPDDLAAWGAYADYLQEQGDPRGEFMQVQLALEDESLTAAERKKLAAREKQLLKAHAADWLGPLAASAPEVARVTFARGWVSRVEFPNLTVHEARALGAADGTRLLRELVVEQTAHEVPVGVEEQHVESHYAPGPDVPADVDPYAGPSLYALCRCPRLATVRLFRLGEEMQVSGNDEYSNCHTPGDLAYHVVKQMPALEELHLLARHVDAAKIFALPLPSLRELRYYHGTSYPLDRLAANPSLTRLTTLLCYPHAMEFDEEEAGAYIRLGHLRAVCRSPHLGALTHLRLRLTDFGDAGARELAESGILKRLKVLDLQGGCVTDEGAARLAACPDLKRLESLNLSRNAMTPAGAALLQSTGVRVDVANQHGQVPGGDGDDETPEYLFEGDME